MKTLFKATFPFFSITMLALATASAAPAPRPAGSARAEPALRPVAVPPAAVREEIRTSPDRRSTTLKTSRTSAVRVSEETLVLPTYEMGPPERNPIFYTQESYQGAQKRVYPYALQDHLTQVRTNKAYKALKLENPYVQVTILPELGGHLFEAVDKSNGYDIFYRQHVIKPALIGMLGAWISGGIEWCAFHHHRNTTFMPVDYLISTNSDGSKTVWIGETERRHRMRWLIGISLYPDKSYIEATVKFFNRTPVAHSILYWANVAVHVNEDYQVIFPPSVQVATYHSKIDFTQWPIAQGRYRGMDYTGVDLSWWKNHPEPNSFFAWDLQEDFMGGYDHGRNAGVVHVANHHVVGGAKLWEWGTGPNGRMWDKILTDEDGPYAELMVGAWSDNQPDYSWIRPHEVKTFKQYWFPVRELSGFKNANLNGAVNLQCRTNGSILLAFNTTSRHRKAKAQLFTSDRLLHEAEIEIGPGRVYRKELTLPLDIKEKDLRAVLLDAEGKEVIGYRPVVREPVKELPKPVKAPPSPKDIETVEELYLTGLRIEQIHNPSVNPTKYYQEALARDPGDSRANTAMGLHYLKRAMYTEAEGHLRRAVERISAEYTRPANAEALYYLGQALRAQGRYEDAYTQFHRAIWDSAWRAAAFYQLAEVSCRKGLYDRGLEEVNEALAANAQDTKARNLKAALLRKLGRFNEAESIAAGSLRLDPLDFLALNELRLARQEAGEGFDLEEELTRQRQRMRGEVQSYLELATDYLNWGLYSEAVHVLTQPIEQKIPFASTYPLVYYYLAHALTHAGRTEQAGTYYHLGQTMPADYCFPFRLETLDILREATRLHPEDARGWYYLGNLLYDLQPENALECWAKARTLDPAFATTHRNLGWGYYRIKNDLTNAMRFYEKAVEVSRPDTRLLVELDTLYEFANTPPSTRLALLDKHSEIVRSRGESLTRAIAVQVLSGQYDAAVDQLATNFFHVREGGGEIHDIYVDAHLLKGLQHQKAGENQQALEHFRRASEYPENLSVGRPRNDRRAAQVNFHLAEAYGAAGDAETAKTHYRQSAEQRETRGSADTRYFQALSWRKLGDQAKAQKIFDELLEQGMRGLKDEEGTDFFAKFGEQETRQTRKAGAHYTCGLAHLGKGDTEQARREFQEAARLNQSHVWAKYWLASLN